MSTGQRSSTLRWPFFVMNKSVFVVIAAGVATASALVVMQSLDNGDVSRSQIPAASVSRSEKSPSSVSTSASFERKASQAASENRPKASEVKIEKLYAASSLKPVTVAPQPDAGFSRRKASSTGSSDSSDLSQPSGNDSQELTRLEELPIPMVDGISAVMPLAFQVNPDALNAAEQQAVQRAQEKFFKKIEESGVPADDPAYGPIWKKLQADVDQDLRPLLGWQASRNIEDDGLAERYDQERRRAAGLQ